MAEVRFEPWKSGFAWEGYRIECGSNANIRGTEQGESQDFERINRTQQMRKNDEPKIIPSPMTFFTPYQAHSKIKVTLWSIFTSEKSFENKVPLENQVTLFLEK